MDRADRTEPLTGTEPLTACPAGRNWYPHAPDGESTVGTEHRVEWPPWWEWELELTPHVERRMEDRAFTEVELRQMLETAHGYRDDPVTEGRFIVETRRRGADWEVVVEPDDDDHWLVVVTAYPLGAGR